MDKDTPEVLKAEIEDKEEKIKESKASLILRLMDIDSDMQDVLTKGEYDTNYFNKASAEMDYRLRHGTENGEYKEPELPKPEKEKETSEDNEEPRLKIERKVIVKKSAWTLMKENFKKIIL